MHKFSLLSLGLALALGACATTAQNAFLTAETTDSAALAALLVYENSGKASPAELAKLWADQNAIDATLAPAEALVKAGQPITNTSAITLAVTALVADEAAAGIQE